MSIKQSKETKLCKNENSYEILEQKLIEKLKDNSWMLHLTWLCKTESFLVEYNTEYKTGSCTNHVA